MTVEVPQDKAGARKKLLQNLDSIFQAVDKVPLTIARQQIEFEVVQVSHLSKANMAPEYSITWIEREIERRATGFLKKWACMSYLIS